jgi:hypothetical protein
LGQQLGSVKKNTILCTSPTNFCSSSFYFSVLCFSVLFCIWYPMSPVSLECLFLLAITIFCHAYYIINILYSDTIFFPTLTLHLIHSTSSACVSPFKKFFGKISKTVLKSMQSLSALKTVALYKKSEYKQQARACRMTETIYM